MSRPFAILSLLVGLAIFLGSGWLAIDSVRDLYAFPAKATEVQLAQLAGLREVPRGTWVRLAGDFELEAGPVQPSSGGPHYLLVREREARVVVAFEERDYPHGLAAPAKQVWSGVPSIRQTSSASSSYRDLPRKLAFEGVDWGLFPEGRVVILWTYQGPKGSKYGVALGVIFGLVGAAVIAMALGNLRRPTETMDAMWTEAALPKAVRLSAFAGARARAYSWLLLGWGVLWLAGFGCLELSKGKLGLRAGIVLGLGLAFLLLGLALRRRARRLSGHQYFADLVWLPVLRSRSVRSEGVATGVMAYDVELPAGAKPSQLTVHSGPRHGGLVFRDPSRSEVLAARPLHSVEILVLSSSLREIRENPLAPLAHPRHRLVKLA